MKSRRSVSPIYNVLDGVASPVRLRMLRSLARQKLGYSELAKAVGMDRNKDAGKFSYHLKKLLSCGLIEVDSSVGKYTLSQKGATVLKYLDKIEEELGEKTLMIVRRSDQLIEPFNKDKISEALVKEARLSPKLAREIASIAEKKLLDLKIDYLTAPLIRELVNSILLDMGLEKYRHRLTRLGMPLYDAERLLKKTFSSGDWRIFLEKSSGSIAREYALLDFLPREVAELHLTGRIDIYPISSWVTGFFARKLSIDPGDVIKSSVKIVFASFSTKKEIKISGPRQQVKKILEALSRMPLDKRLISLEYSDSTLESLKNLDTQSRRRLGLIVDLAKLDLSEVGKVNKTLMKARLRHVYSTSDEVGFTGFVLDEERRDLHSIISINVLGAALEEKGDLDATLQRISDYVKLVIPIVKRELSLIN
ncbi:MAG: helix-turn-helix domain-containing protein, partial [Thaumarchaeota archaeon]|nr:helix-turn-helix domain-containing protein [Nitrososphaerota archaeon]